MNHVEYEDLLRVPFEFGGDDPAHGLDCWGIAREVNRRAGHTLPDTPRLDMLQPATGELQVGDMLVSDPEGLGHPSHVAVIVAPGWALSTSARRGPRCLPVHRTRMELGAWRSS